MSARIFTVILVAMTMLSGCKIGAMNPASLSVDVAGGMDHVSILDDIGYTGPDPETSIRELQAILDFCSSDQEASAAGYESMRERYGRFYRELRAAATTLREELIDSGSDSQVSTLIQRYDSILADLPHPTDLLCPGWTGFHNRLFDIVLGTGYGPTEIGALPSRAGIQDGGRERSIHRSPDSVDRTGYHIGGGMDFETFRALFLFESASDSAKSRAARSGANNYIVGFDNLSNGTTGLGFFNDVESASEVEADTTTLEIEFMLKHRSILNSLWSPYVSLSWRQDETNYDESTIVPSIPNIFGSASVETEVDTFTLSAGVQFETKLTKRFDLIQRYDVNLHRSSADLYAMQLIDFQGMPLTAMVDDSDDKYSFGMEAEVVLAYELHPRWNLEAYIRGGYVADQFVPDNAPQTGDDLHIRNRPLELGTEDAFGYDAGVRLRARF
ncbi:MAG: hypothetical protein GKR90_13940 [Pseudomonadales bacterium]|nr:hypothetical protein [Pseudomonadales bacterium]